MVIRRTCEMSRRALAESPPRQRASPGAHGEGSQFMVLWWGGAAIIVLVGVADLIEPRINLRPVFGVLLCGLVIARFYWCVKHRGFVGTADIRDLSRHLSRMVYLLLYLTIGARQVIGGFRGFDGHEDFQILVVYGLIALALIRVVAFGIWLRAAHGDATISVLERMRRQLRNAS
jgi:hypothetical protein